MKRIRLVWGETPVGELFCRDESVVMAGEGADQRSLVGVIIEREMAGRERDSLTIVFVCEAAHEQPVVDLSRPFVTLRGSKDRERHPKSLIALNIRWDWLDPDESRRFGRFRFQFDGPSGAGHIRFDGPSGFGHIEFDGPSGFGHIRFDGPSGFGHIRFDGPSGFGHIEFDGPSGFGHIRFRGSSGFGHIRFDGSSGFGRIRFGWSPTEQSAWGQIVRFLLGDRVWADERPDHEDSLATVPRSVPAAGLPEVAAHRLIAVPETTEAMAFLANLAEKTARWLTEWRGTVPRAPGPPLPWATAYRPSWVLPRRQSSIYVYILLPEVKDEVDKEAHASLDAHRNCAKEAKAITLSRVLDTGEVLTAEVKLPGFDVGEPVSQQWRAPQVRFVIPILAHPGTALGIHRPLVTISDSDEQVLATFDFDLELRVRPKPSPLQGMVEEVKAVLAELRDRATVYVSYAIQDLERVKRAAHFLQKDGRFPSADVDELITQKRTVEEIKRAHRFFLFWSRNAAASHEVKSEWLSAVGAASQKHLDKGFLMPVLLDHNRPASDHPLARFDTIDLAALADVLIVTAVAPEYAAVRTVEAGAVPNTTWADRTGPAGLEVAFREFTTYDGTGILRVAVTQALGMGGVKALLASGELIKQYSVRCLAMCGVCAGRRGEVELGDVIIADRLWQYDTGKHKVEVDAQGERKVHDQADIDMYKIRPDNWIHAGERFKIDPAIVPYIASRPYSYAAQGDWILERRYRDVDPETDPGKPTQCPQLLHGHRPSLEEKAPQERYPRFHTRRPYPHHSHPQEVRQQAPRTETIRSARRPDR
jgi:hypothetical protein